MRKIIILTLMLGVLFSAAAFAEGVREKDDRPGPGSEWNEGPGYGRGPHRGRGYAPGYNDRRDDYDGELVTVTGTVEYGRERHPELETAEGTYELMYPRYLDYSIDVESGDTVTVEGFLVPGPRWEEDGDAQFLMVTKAVIDGEEYEVDHPGMFGRGRFSGDERYSYGGGGPRRGGRGRGMYGAPGGCYYD